MIDRLRLSLILVVVLLMAPGPAVQSFGGLIAAAPAAHAEVVPPPSPPPAVGALVADDPLTEIGMVRPDFCPTGRGAGQFTENGFKMTVNGRCTAALPVAIVTTALNGVTLNDGDVEVEIVGSGAVDRALLQLFVRLQGGSGGYNGYGVTWSPSGGTADLQRLRDGRGSSLARRIDLPPISLADGATIGLRVQGPTFWLLVNGEPVLSGTDPSDDAIDTGRFGFAVIREGNVDDDADLSVTWRNIRLSRLAESDTARAPTYRPPAGTAGGPFVPPSGTPPAPGDTLHEEPMNTDKPAWNRPSLFINFSCPTGNGSQEFMDEGLRLETHGKCYETSTGVTVGQAPNMFVNLPDAELRFEFKIGTGVRRAVIGVGMRVQDDQSDGLYWFGISPGNGVAAITRLGRDDRAVLSRRPDVGSILTRDGWNRVAIRMSGSQLWLLLNDHPVLKAEDGALSRGGFYINLDRLGDPNDREQVNATLRNLQISAIKGSPKNRRPESIVFSSSFDR